MSNHDLVEYTIQVPAHLVSSLQESNDAIIQEAVFQAEQKQRAKDNGTLERKKLIKAKTDFFAKGPAIFAEYQRERPNFPDAKATYIHLSITHSIPVLGIEVLIRKERQKCTDIARSKYGRLIVKLALKGWKQKNIARQVGCSTRTVQRTLAKLRKPRGNSKKAQRHAQIIELMLEGNSQGVIAKKVGCTTRTVQRAKREALGREAF